MQYHLRLLLLFSIHGLSDSCFLTEVQSLLEGCSHLAGLNVTAAGGTIVSDHNCDVLLPKQVFSEEPLFQFEAADSSRYYTMFMVDADAPPQLDGEFYLHMLKFNVPGSALKSKDASKTNGIDYRSYRPPAPTRGSGPHRFMNLLYEQADGNNFLPNSGITRYRFSISDWMRGKNLCGPVAATMFRVQY